MKHEKIAELLPWYANQTLEIEERNHVEAHLRVCGECARELAVIENLQRGVTMAAEETPEPAPFLFSRVLGQIDEYEREKSDRRWWQFSPRFVRVAMLAQLAVILALGILLLNRNREFTTASGPSAGTRIVVGFQPGVTEEAVRFAIQELKGTIVAGPSNLGLYTVQVPQQDSAALQKLIENMSRNQAVVRIAAVAP